MLSHLRAIWDLPATKRSQFGPIPPKLSHFTHVLASADVLIIIFHQITSFTCASSNFFHNFLFLRNGAVLYVQPPKYPFHIPDPSLISHYHVNDLHNGIFTLNHPPILYQLEKAKYVSCFPDQTTNFEFSRIFLTNKNRLFICYYCFFFVKNNPTG